MVDGGEPTTEEKEQHKRRFNKIKQFLLIGNERNFFIKHQNFETPLDDPNENVIYNNLKDIIGSDTENSIKKINVHFKDISKFRLYDDDGEFFMNSPNYIYIIKMLANFIDKNFCISMIRSKSAGFNSIYDMNTSNTNKDYPILHKIESSGIIQYIIEEHSNYLSPIITSFNDIIYKYYLTLDTNIFRELLSEKEIHAAQEEARKAEEEAAAAKQAEQAKQAKEAKKNQMLQTARRVNAQSGRTITLKNESDLHKSP